MKTVKSHQHESKPFSKDESYWQNQIKLQGISSLSKAAYCRINKINYDQFNYWIKRLSNIKDILLPVKIKEASQVSSEGSTFLCTVKFKNGSHLCIYDKETLLMVLDRLASI